MLLEGEDGYRLSDREDREIYEAVENLFVLDRGQRRLFTLANLLPRALGARLHKWVEGGRYAALFDNPRRHADAWIDCRCSTSRRCGRTRRCSSRCCSTCSTASASGFYDPSEVGTLKLCVMDEAWRLHPASDAQGVRAGGAQDLAQAERGDAPGDAERRRLRVGRSPSNRRRELPDEAAAGEPVAGPAQYAELFQLNEAELDLLAG